MSDEFTINSQLHLMKDGDCIRVIMRICGEESSIIIGTSYQKKLVKAIQQHWETETFEKPPRWSVRKNRIDSSLFCAHQEDCGDLNCHNNVIWMTKPHAQAIVDALNAVEEL